MPSRCVHVWAPRLQAFGGGIGACARQVIRAMETHDWQVRSCAKDDVCAPGGPALGAGRAPGALRTSWFALLASWQVMRHRPALVVVLHANFAPLAWLFRRLIGLRYVVVAHGIEIDTALRPARQRALREADAVWAVSRWTRERAIALGVRAERIAVIGNTFDEERFVAKAAADVRRTVPTVLTVARLDRSEGYKGCDVVLQALALLRTQGRHVRYRIVGSGNDMPRLRALVERLELSGMVEFVGQVDDAALLAAYRDADLFVMASRGEGFGIVFLEAMASGTPVIGGCADGTVDALGDGALGRLVDPDDSADVARAMADLLERNAPAAWFDPTTLRAACVASHGHEAFDARIRAAVSVAMEERR